MLRHYRLNLQHRSSWLKTPYLDFLRHYSYLLVTLKGTDESHYSHKCSHIRIVCVGYTSSDSMRMNHRLRSEGVAESLAETLMAASSVGSRLYTYCTYRPSSTCAAVGDTWTPRLLCFYFILFVVVWFSFAAPQIAHKGHTKNILRLQKECHATEFN